MLIHPCPDPKGSEHRPGFTLLKTLPPCVLAHPHMVWELVQQKEAQLKLDLRFGREPPAGCLNAVNALQLEITLNVIEAGHGLGEGLMDRTWVANALGTLS